MCISTECRPPAAPRAFATSNSLNRAAPLCGSARRHAFATTAGSSLDRSQFWRDKLAGLRSTRRTFQSSDGRRTPRPAASISVPHLGSAASAGSSGVTRKRSYFSRSSTRETLFPLKLLPVIQATLLGRVNLGWFVIAMFGRVGFHAAHDPQQIAAQNTLDLLIGVTSVDETLRNVRIATRVVELRRQ